jgi:hypothetical protein
MEQRVSLSNSTHSTRLIQDQGCILRWSSSIIHQLLPRTVLSRPNIHDDIFLPSGQNGGSWIENRKIMISPEERVSEKFGNSRQKSHRILILEYSHSFRTFPSDVSRVTDIVLSNRRL